MEYKENDTAADARLVENVRYYSSLGPQSVSDRIRALDMEMEMERAVVAGLAGVGVFSSILGAMGMKTFRLVGWLSLPALLTYALGKWHLPEALKGTFGLRCRREIDDEKMALKAIRGDFQDLADPVGVEEAGSHSKMAGKVVEALRV